MNESVKMWSIRFKSFGWSLLSFLAVGLGGMLLSPEFSSLVTDHFGNTFITSTILLLLPEVVKHLRNKQVVNKVELGKSVGRVVEEAQLI